jgi:Carboxypeptidase regulatory-like domain/Pectate lyase superfamily protein/SdrD B-like domain
MSIYKRFLRQPRVAASIALILFSAVAITAQTSEKIFNLADFGPVGNGVADDGPALRKALDALAGAGGGTLNIPAGSYRIATPVVKDFSSIPGAKVTIRGVPSTKMPATVTALGHELAEGLDLTSRIIPATGNTNNAIKISNLHQLLIEHVDFSGSPEAETDALITLYFIDIDQATIRHCEFYGLSSMDGGNMVRAERSELSIELSVFLGCTANSGVYAPVVENLEWRKFSISNSIFLDYGLREFFSKTGMGAPLSWVNIGNAAPTTPDSPRREVIVRDVFLDEGGWVGISVLPSRFSTTPTTIDLIYISGLKMNVSNLATTGHLIYDVRNLMIENSHYSWSVNASSALEINFTENVILDNLTCIDHADRIQADASTGRLTVINSVYQTLDSLAGTTTVLETSPEQDPVQYVRQQFMTALGRPPDAAAHFYWSDLLIRCESNKICLNEKRSALSEYLSKQPKENFSLSGTVTDENGDPLSDAAVSLTGSQSLDLLTDAQGKFQFSGLPTSGVYTVAVNKRHYTLPHANQTFVHPAADVNVVFAARLNRHSIEGRITREDGTAMSGVVVQLAPSPTTVTTDSDGRYSFAQLAAGKNYTVVPVLEELAFTPENTTFEDLSENQVRDFIGNRSFDLAGTVSDENGDPLGDVTVKLTGSKTSSAVTDSQGRFMFAGLSVSGSYTVSVDKQHYTFTSDSQTFVQPVDDVMAVFGARLNRHSITGRLTRIDGTGIGGVVVQLATATTTTDANGFYSFTELEAGGSYTVVPASNEFVFTPVNTTFDDLSVNRAANFVGKLEPELMTIDGSALALDSVSLTAQPFSLLNALGLNNDGFIRVMVFAKNFEPVTSPSQISVVAKEDKGQAYPIEVEYVADVPGLSWLKQINVKLPANTLSGKCVQLQLTVADVNSNDARICIK